MQVLWVPLGVVTQLLHGVSFVGEEQWLPSTPAGCLAVSSVDVKQINRRENIVMMCVHLRVLGNMRYEKGQVMEAYTVGPVSPWCQLKMDGKYSGNRIASVLDKCKLFCVSQYGITAVHIPFTLYWILCHPKMVCNMLKHVCRSCTIYLFERQS